MLAWCVLCVRVFVALKSVNVSLLFVCCLLMSLHVVLMWCVFVVVLVSFNMFDVVCCCRFFVRILMLFCCVFCCLSCI